MLKSKGIFCIYLCSNLMVSQKVKNGRCRHAGFDPASLYFQILLDSSFLFSPGALSNGWNPTFSDLVKLNGKGSKKSVFHRIFKKDIWCRKITEFKINSFFIRVSLHIHVFIEYTVTESVRSCHIASI